MHHAACDQLFERLLASDRPGARALIDAFAAQHGYQAAVELLLEPVLSRIGSLWNTDQISLAQGYIAAKLVSETLERVAAEAPSWQGKRRGIVVVGNIEDDFHALGRRLVTIFLRVDGWEVHDLGNDVVASHFVDTALDVGARVIGASAMMTTTALNIRQLRAELDRRAPHIQLAVGGAVFCLRPEMVSEVGGDGSAPNALAAPALFQRLWQQSAP